MELKNIEFVEFYVGNAYLTSAYYQQILGFQLFATKERNFINKDISSYVLIQGNIKIVLTSSLNKNDDISTHVLNHGDSVKRVAFGIDSIDELKQKCIENNVTVVSSESNLDFRSLEILTYGDTTHLFIENLSYKSYFNTSYIIHNYDKEYKGIGLYDIDHITANVELGSMDHWISYYKKILSLDEMLFFDGEDLSSDDSSMMSKVVWNGDNIRLPISQPVNKGKKSQIQEFIEYNSGAGVQHIAVSCINIVETVEIMRNRGVEFLQISDNYYDDLESKNLMKSYGINSLRENNILLDESNDGLLFQAFTKPLLDRPTYFLEIIERHQTDSFGKANVKALYNALVNEQNKRGYV